MWTVTLRCGGNRGGEVVLFIAVAREVALLVSTDQIGNLVIRLDDEQFVALRSEIDRMKTYRSAPPLPQ